MTDLAAARNLAAEAIERYERFLPYYKVAGVTDRAEPLARELLSALDALEAANNLIAQYELRVERLKEERDTGVVSVAEPPAPTHPDKEPE